jgi:hypothetical protein
MSMTKMDKTWISVTSLIYPETDSKTGVLSKEVASKMVSMFGTKADSSYLNTHLVSFKDKQCDKNDTSRGGSRNRYLFKTIDGKIRLYKNMDMEFDGWDKSGKICPKKEDINSEYHHLLDWYRNQYYSD